MDQTTVYARVPTLRFSTAAFAPNRRISAWREEFGQGVLRVGTESLLPAEEFRATATLRRLPGLNVVTAASTPVRFERKRHMLDSDDISLSIALAGESRFAINGREEYTLRTGDATLTGAGEGGVDDTNDCRFIVLRVPKKSIATSRPIEELVGRRIPAEIAPLRMLRSYIGVLDDPALLATADLQRLAAIHVQDLVALTLGATRDAAEIARERGANAARLRAIKTDIAQNLTHDDLSVATVAARHRLTVRYVQRLFEAEGTNFTQFVLEQRLARAHRILVNPRCAHLKISIVAIEAGFSNMSYFYEAFRRRYGASPSDLREQARTVN